MPKLASQIRVAFSSMAWNTGSSSPGELLMTCSTSEVAVCCSSASLRSSVRWRSSLSSRVFSMAMTAWAAKFVNKLDLLVGERSDHLPINAEETDELGFLQHRHPKDRPNPTELHCGDRLWTAFEVCWVC